MPEEKKIEEQQPTPVAPAAEPQQPQAAEPMPTEADLQRMARRNDKAGMDKAAERIRQAAAKEGAAPKAEKPAEKPAEPPAAAAPAPAAAAEAKPAERKYYKIRIDDQEQQIADDDGFLGYGGAEGLKKATAHQLRLISTLQSRADQMRNMAGDKERQAAALEAKVKEYEEKLAKAQATTPVPAAAPTAAPTAAEQLVPPTPPELPDEIVDWTKEHVAADKKYKREVADYLKKLAERKPDPAVGADVEARVTAEIKKLREEQAAAQAAEAARLRAEREAEDHWRNLRQFQSMHKEFETPVDIEQLHKAIVGDPGHGTSGWGDQVAAACGVFLPASATKQDVDNYESRKWGLVDSLLKGDQTVAQRCVAVKAPEGVEAYFRLSDLHRKRNQLIADGELGPKADLHKVWLYEREQSGELTTDIEALRAKEFERGTKAVGQVVREHAAHATVIPNSMGQAGPSPVVADPSGTALTQEEIELLNVPVAQLMRNKALLAKYNDLGEKLNRLRAQAA